ERPLPPPTPIWPASPSTPNTPRVLVHFRGAQLLLCDLLLQANPLVLLILRLLADKEHVLLWVRENVIEGAVPLDRGNLVRRKRIEMGHPFRRVRRDHFETCGGERVFLVLGRAAANGQGHEHASS